MLGAVIRRVWRDVFSRRGAAMQMQASDESLRALLRTPGAISGPVNYVSMAWLIAASDAARYMATHMASAQDLIEREALLDFALGKSAIDGLVMEFGVYKGASLRRIAARAAQAVHGFDAFEGLPEDWTFFQKRGRFDLGGQVPRFDEKNIVIHRGWFDRTLESFLAGHPGSVRFLHVDCDLYASARCVLDRLAPRIVPGSIILFDEYLNYPGWEQHEFRAFQEFVVRHGLGYRYIGFASNSHGVAVQIEESGNS